MLHDIQPCNLYSFTKWNFDSHCVLLFPVRTRMSRAAGHCVWSERCMECWLWCRYIDAAANAELDSAVWSFGTIAACFDTVHVFGAWHNPSLVVSSTNNASSQPVSCWSRRRNNAISVRRCCCCCFATYVVFSSLISYFGRFKMQFLLLAKPDCAFSQAPCGFVGAVE